MCCWVSVFPYYFFEGTLTVPQSSKIKNKKKSTNIRNQGFSNLFWRVVDGMIRIRIINDWSGSGRLKNIGTDPDPQYWLHLFVLPFSTGLTIWSDCYSLRLRRFTGGHPCCSWVMVVHKGQRVVGNQLQTATARHNFVFGFTYMQWIRHMIFLLCWDAILMT